MRPGISILSFCLFSYAISQAQVAPKSTWPVAENSANFYSIQTAFYSAIDSIENYYELFGFEFPEKDEALEKFKRWEYIMQTRVDANGNFPQRGILFTEKLKYAAAHPDAFAGSRSASWYPVGSADAPSSGGGVGRINALTFHPDDDHILFVATAGGGLWKSPDAGDSWIPLTDNIPVLSVGDVVIDPDDPQIIYIATGDSYGYEATWQSDEDFWGGLYSGGILKSTDGGLTWNPTGFSYEQADLEIVQRLLILPSNPDILLAATRSGVYRTTDAGATWSLVLDKHCYDFAFRKDGSGDIITGGNRDVFLSTDDGATWSTMKDNLCDVTDRMSLETTADNSNSMYCLCANGGSGQELFKSEDGGLSWDEETSPTSKISMYGYYDNVLAVSDVDETLLFAGGLDIARTTNGASSWNKMTDWAGFGGDDYVHADNHDLKCDPTDVNIVYSMNDGGIFKSTDKGDTWTDLSDGLRIAQIYRISTGQAADDRVLGGWQDNGTNYWNGTDYEQVIGGDGMEAIIDHTDPDVLFHEYYNGYVERSDNEGVSWTDKSPSTSGAWVTPYVMDPVNHSILYYGDSNGDVYKTTSAGNTWTNKNSNISGGEIFSVAVAPADPAFVYAATLTQLKHSEDAGDTWLPAGTFLSDGTGINYIAVSDADPLHVYVAVSGYAAGEKVFYSENGGVDWTNISGTLPNVPVNCIVYENGSDGRVYIGTDIGIFTRDNTSTDWETYMDGLPNVMVHELEINYTRSKIVAATYGRGVWESDIYDFVSPTIVTAVDELEYCPLSSLDVHYEATGVFTAGNVFTAQLSNSDGSFASPLIIGSLASTDLSGTISCTLPSAAGTGDGFRIRVVSSTPSLSGFDNGSDIAITCAVPDDLAFTDISDISVTLSWGAVSCAESYKLQYRKTGTSAWTTITTTDESYTITDLEGSTAYEWHVQTICTTVPSETASEFSGLENFTTLQTGITSMQLLEQTFTISPNPVADISTAGFTLAQDETISITLLDAAGKKMEVLFSGKLTAGEHTVALDKKDLSAGNYLVEISNGSSYFTKGITVN